MAAPSPKNIQPAQVANSPWDPNNPVQSLEAVRRAVEDEAQSAIQWYWRQKRWKRVPSQWIRFFAFLLTAAAGLIPIVTQIARDFRNDTGRLDSGQIASLCVGVAAALFGLDKAFGYSTGWTRYVLAATSLTKLLHEFRMDWTVLLSAAGTTPSTEQQAGMILRAKEFLSGVQSTVMQETKEWATEFQSSMAQMEKDLKTQLDALKVQMEREAKAKEAGAIELTVTNADQTDGFQFHVVLEGKAGKFADTVDNSKIWSRIETVPGQYRVVVNAKTKGAVVSTSTVAVVKPGEVATASATLPIV